MGQGTQGTKPRALPQARTHKAHGEMITTNVADTLFSFILIHRKATEGHESHSTMTSQPMASRKAGERPSKMERGMRVANARRADRSTYVEGPGSATPNQLTSRHWRQCPLRGRVLVRVTESATAHTAERAAATERAPNRMSPH